MCVYERCIFIVKCKENMCICLCFRAVLEGLWLRFKGEEVETDVARERRRRILQTLVWFCLTLILALFIPDIGRVISLIGGLAACFIFVFPGITVKLFLDFTFCLYHISVFTNSDCIYSPVCL